MQTPDVTYVPTLHPLTFVSLAITPVAHCYLWRYVGCVEHPLEHLAGRGEMRLSDRFDHILTW